VGREYRKNATCPPEGNRICALLVLLRISKVKLFYLLGKLVKFESKSVGVESRNYRALSKAFVVRMNCVS